MSVNKVILVGRAGKDPELRFTASGTPVANFSLATDERYKDRNGEQKQDTEWHQIVVWRELAEKVVAKYVAKGSLVYLEGKIKTRNYEDRDGNRKYMTEVHVDQFRLLGPKSDAQATNSGQRDTYQGPGNQQPSGGESSHGPDCTCPQCDIPF